MKKSNIIKVIILLLALGLNVKTLKSLHAEQVVINADRPKISKLPLASFHKFWADIQWMLMIQHMGSIDLTTEQNSKELYSEANTIIDLDPGFYKAYEISSLMLSAKKPQFAINLLKRGQASVHTTNDWRLYSMAGNIRQQEIFFNKGPDNLTKLRESIEFYREALNKPGVISVLEKSFIKSLAQERFESKGDKLLISELQEWFKHLSQSNYMNGEGEHGNSTEGYMSVSEEVKSELLSLIQKIKQEHPNDSKGRAISDKVIKALFKDIHICFRCFHEYHKGDKYCNECSKPVKIFGVCSSPDCAKVIRGHKFCEHCGKHVVKPKRRK